MTFRSLLMVLLVVVGIMTALKLGLIPSVVSKIVSKASKSVVGSVSKSASKYLELPNVNVDVLLSLCIYPIIGCFMYEAKVNGARPYLSRRSFNIQYYFSILIATLPKTSMQ